MVPLHEGYAALIQNNLKGAYLITFDHGMMKCFIWIDMRIFFFFVFQIHLDRFCVVTYSALHTNSGLSCVIMVNFQILMQKTIRNIFIFFAVVNREYFLNLFGDFILFFFAISVAEGGRLSWNKLL